MKRFVFSTRIAAGAAVLALAACQESSDLATATINDPIGATQGVPTLARADGDMAAVLAALQALGPQPITELSPQEARRQPTIADAVEKVQRDRGRNPLPPRVEGLENVSIEGLGGPIPARIYTPAGTGPFPVIVYYHGGGWVLADLDTYDASARALATEANAIVVASDYRHAPEHKFPAAHNDAFSAYEWVLDNARSFGGDPERVAVAGESAGGSMAIGVSRLARQHSLKLPVHQLLVYPVAGADMNTASYQENENARPLNKAGMTWFFENYLSGPADRNDPLIDVVNAPDLAGLPPTTVITAEIDPLRAEGQTLAERLEAAGVPVESMNYDGVTHEFFGIGPAVADSTAAQAFAAQRLRTAFARVAAR